MKIVFLEENSFLKIFNSLNLLLQVLITIKVLLVGTAAPVVYATQIAIRESYKNNPSLLTSVGDKQPITQAVNHLLWKGPIHKDYFLKCF